MDSNRLRQLYGLAGQHVDAVEEQVAANGCRPAIAQVLTIEDFEPVNVRTWLAVFPTDMIVYAPPGATSAMGLNHSHGAQWAAVSAPAVDTVPLTEAGWLAMDANMNVL